MNKLITAFVIFSFFGWVWESIYCTIRTHKWANRGFLYGPLCPIYGIAGILGLNIYSYIKIGFLPELPWWALFISGFAVSMLLEYPISMILEKLFHARWWDYSYLPLNINGRTSVPTSAAFGLAAIPVMKIIIPFFWNVITDTPDSLTDIVAVFFVAVISMDFTLTVSALTDFQHRVANLDDSFQNTMSDAVEHIYSSQNIMYKKAIDRIAVIKHKEKKVFHSIKEKRKH